MKRKPKISRRKADHEINADPEKQQHLKELAIAFQEEQVKIVLRKLYKNVQQYGAEVVLEAVNQNWLKTEEEWEETVDGDLARWDLNFKPSNASFVVGESIPEIEEAATKEIVIENLEEIESCGLSSSGIRHKHLEVLKRNALFLIESSEKIEDYDQDTLAQMKRCYERANYDDVLDLAFLHDREKRPLRIGTFLQTTTQERPPKPQMKTVVELLEEVAGEDSTGSIDSKETALQACVSALRHLSRDLTYEERTSAKQEIRKVIGLLEE